MGIRVQQTQHVVDIFILKFKHMKHYNSYNGSSISIWYALVSFSFFHHVFATIIFQWATSNHRIIPKQLAYILTLYNGNYFLSQFLLRNAYVGSIHPKPCNFSILFNIIVSNNLGWCKKKEEWNIVRFLKGYTRNWEGFIWSN